MRTRHCAVTAHTRKLPDRPHVDDALHRQMAQELEQELHDCLCDELEQELSKELENPAFWATGGIF